MRVTGVLKIKDIFIMDANTFFGQAIKSWTFSSIRSDIFISITENKKIWVWCRV